MAPCVIDGEQAVVDCPETRSRHDQQRQLEVHRQVNDQVSLGKWHRQATSTLNEYRLVLLEHWPARRNQVIKIARLALAPRRQHRGQWCFE